MSIAGVLDLNNKNVTVTGLSGGGTITNNSTGTPTFTANIASGTQTFNGIIQNGLTGSVALTESGGGTLALTGINTYTGSTTISGGTLSIGNGGGGASLASTPILDSATLMFNHNDTVSYSGSISGTGQLIQQGTGSSLLILTGNNGYSGGTTITSGTLQLGHVHAMGTGWVTLLAGTLDLAGFSPNIGALNGNLGSTITNSSNTPATLTTNVAGTATFGGFITDDGTVGLTKSGAGLLILSASNGYSGGTTIGGGTLQLGHASAMGTGWVALYAGTLDLGGVSPTIGALSGTTDSIITNNGGNASALTTNIAGTSTFAGLIADGTNTVALTKSGGGTLILSGANTYGGGTIVNYGTLLVANATGSATGTGNVTMNGGVLASNPTNGGTISGSVLSGGVSDYTVAPGGIGT